MSILSDYILEKIDENTIFITRDVMFVDINSLAMVSILIKLGKNLELDLKYETYSEKYAQDDQDEHDDISNLQIMYLMFNPEEDISSRYYHIMTDEDEKLILDYKLEGTIYDKIICELTDKPFEEKELTPEIFDTWNTLFKGKLKYPYVDIKSARKV